MAVVEDLKRIRVLAVHEGHQILVGEALQRPGVWLRSHTLEAPTHDRGTYHTNAPSVDQYVRPQQDS